jgi:putative salt-induced outer membrane protein YdiY
MKYFLAIFNLLIFLSLALFADQSSDINSTISSDTNGSVISDGNVIQMKDTSGLSNVEIQKIAEKKDKKEQKKIIENPVKASDFAWKDLAPEANKYDWIELKSGEWLKGKFEGMYAKKLEFDSKKLKFQTFDFEDIKQIRTHRLVSLSIIIEDDRDDGLFGLKQTLIEATGILRLKGEKVTLIRGDGNLEFDRSQIVSIAYGAKSEAEYWSGKITLGLDTKKGNTNKLDFTVIANLQRRTSKTRLKLDYIGNIFNSSNQETANNHRVNESFDVFMTKEFYYTPVFSEYFRDPYQNIRQQYTVGIGLGYTLIDTKRTHWDISGGPALIYTKYDTVEVGKELTNRTGAVELNTAYDIEITKRIDFKFNYKITLTQKSAGEYKHHMVTTFENEITSWLDIDLTMIWDYTKYPKPNEDLTIPQKSDLQFVVSFGIDF